MRDSPVRAGEVQGDADFWALLEGEAVTAPRQTVWDAWPDDEAASLETVVRRHGGRLPGHDPRR